MTRAISWTNVRPLDDDYEAAVLRVYFSIDGLFREPAWASFEPEVERRQRVTIACGRCGKPYSYDAIPGPRRKYCDACVGTNAKPRG